jgi:phosphate-selective porin OprO and OprP
MISSRSSTLPAALVAAAMAWTTPVFGQAAAPADPQAVPAAGAPQVQAAPPFTAGWQDGFFVQSGNADYRLQLSLLLQADDRFAIDDQQNNVVNSFTFRRIRPILQGRVARYFDFYFNPDFAGAIVNVRDSYVETRFSPAFRIRVGKGKEPFGLERLHGAANLTFVERSLPTAVAPDRDVGVQLVGDIAGGLVSYAGGVFNGVVDGGSSEGDTNDGKDVVGRVVVRPFIRKMKSPLAGLGLALAGSSGEQPTALPSFLTSARQTFFTYDRAAVGQGDRHRFSPQYFYYYKSFGTFGEYVNSRGVVANGSVSGDIIHESLMIAGSFVVTGETASDHGVRPRSLFDPGKHTWGALQITARYHSLSVDPKAATLGFVSAGASREAKAFTVGANWYLNPFIKWVFNFERTVFDGDPNGSRHPENAILVRNQIGF